MEESVEDLIREFLAAELGIDGKTITADTKLISSGMVDSAGLIRLAAVVERECDLIIPDRDVTAEHFDSLRLIGEYVDARLS